MEIKQEDRAYECARKALTLDLKHRYSMLLAALLLSNKKNFGQAETCFLSLTSEFPFWLEGIVNGKDNSRERWSSDNNNNSRIFVVPTAFTVYELNHKILQQVEII